MPDRIQQRRTKGWRMPPNSVSVARPTRWGNPFRVGDSVRVGLYEFNDNSERVLIVDQAMAVDLYRRWLSGRGDIRASARRLRGLNLACWCKPGTPCHADVLIDVANEEQEAA